MYLLQVFRHGEIFKVPAFDIQHVLKTFFHFLVSSLCALCDRIVHTLVGFISIDALVLVVIQFTQANNGLADLCGTGALIDQRLIKDS